MKKYGMIFLVTALVIVSAGAQESSSGSAGEAFGAGSPHYEVASYISQSDADMLLTELNERFAVYDRLFRFSSRGLSAPLRVRSFGDRAAYDAYVSARLGMTRNGAVYLHYSQPERRELVIHRGSAEEGRMLPHQVFIQYLRAFVSYPPTWMREGFAIYFNTLSFDPETETLGYEENLSWLETVKALGDAMPELERILRADMDGLPDHFQGVSWALVSFFLNSGADDYFRTLLESFMLLSGSATAAENSRLILEHIRSWTDMEKMGEDFRKYLDSRKTFAELLDAGQQAYLAKDAMMAELYFLSALDMKASHYAPYYYLGLLAYEERNYETAAHYYALSLQHGADEALLKYALGLNAASAGKNDEALRFLKEAAAASPERYRDRVEELIKNISG